MLGDLPKDIINIIFDKFWKIKRIDEFANCSLFLLRRKIHIPQEFIENGASFYQTIKIILPNLAKSHIINNNMYSKKEYEEYVGIGNECGYSEIQMTIFLFLSNFSIIDALINSEKYGKKFGRGEEDWKIMEEIIDSRVFNEGHLWVNY